MVEFLFANGVLPFTISIGIMLSIAFIEGVGMLLGSGIFSFIGSLFPDSVFDYDIETPEISANGLTKFLGWMNFDKVPLLVILVSFLCAFGITGYIIQILSMTILNFFLPSIIAVLIALIISLPFTKMFTSMLSQIIPKDETSAITAADFIGKSAVITLGEARKGFPAEAKFQDRFGQTHYVLVEPEEESILFKSGETVILSEQTQKGYVAFQPDYVSDNKTRS